MYSQSRFPIHCESESKMSGSVSGDEYENAASRVRERRGAHDGRPKV